MNKWYLLILLSLPSGLSAHNGHQAHDYTHKKNRLIVGLVAVGYVIAKPSLLLLPFKALLLPFKLIATLGTIGLFALPAVIAAGVWLTYPHWKKHKKDILAQWDKHKHLITAHVAALTKRGKKILDRVKQDNTLQVTRPQLPPDLSLMPDYRA